MAVQERNCRRYAADHWPDTPIVAYVDNARSAADPEVVRPGYQSMLDAIRAGAAVQVVAREQSRLTRQPSEWEELCTAMQVAGIREVHTSTAGVISVAQGSRIAGRVMAVVDAEYVEQLRVKVRGALDALAEEGRPHGRVPYGYRSRLGPDGRPELYPDPDTAEVVRRIVSEIADGASLGVVAQALEGVPTPRGAPRWHRQTVRAIATSPTVLGLRVHQGKIIGEAAWDPIVDETTWHRAAAALAAGNVTGRDGQVRQVRRTASPHRRYLLTGGISTCAHCDTPLIAARQTVRNGETVPSYTCPHPTRVDGACGKVSIVAHRLETHVTQVVGEWVSTGEAADALNRHYAATGPDRQPLRAELAEVDLQLSALAQRWGSGDLLEFEYDAARRPFMDRRNALVSGLHALGPAPEHVDPSDLAAAWDRAAVEHRRPVIAALTRSVLVRSLRDQAERITVVPIWD